MKQKPLNFQSQNLFVDWISFKFQNFDYNTELKLVDYFFNLGFNSYHQTNQLEPIKVISEHKFQLFFKKNKEKYWEGTVLSFSGQNAYHFYKLVKQEIVDWTIFGDDIALSRLDVYFSERKKYSEKSLNDFFLNCQEKLQTSKINIKYEKNQQGKILKIGNRRSNRYSRIYEKSNSLRFEHEMKGKFINNYSSLIKDDLDQFEENVTINFLHYFGTKLPLNSKYTQWLLIRLRPFRNYYNSKSFLPIKTDYINLNQIDYQQDTNNVLTFLRFLIFVRDLDYKNEFLGNTAYRCVFFELKDFLSFMNLPLNSYQFKKLKVFINNLQKNFIIEKFSDQYFQSLVSVPKVEIFKENRVVKGKVWVVEDLFNYNYPFCFPDLFKSKLTKYQLSVIFEIIVKFSSLGLEKHFDVNHFLLTYSTLSNHDCYIIRRHFIQYINLLVEHNIIEKRFHISKNGVYYETTRLTTRNIVEPFVIYEILNIDRCRI